MVLLKVDYRKSFDREREELCLKVKTRMPIGIPHTLVFQAQPIQLMPLKFLFIMTLLALPKPLRLWIL
jgi:hypothetical protein